MPNDRKFEPLQKRHSRRQQQRRRAKLIRRGISLGLLAVIFLCIIIFFTPLFNIQSVQISGNSVIETAELEQRLSGTVGSNLFLTRRSSIENIVMSFAYADKVSVKRRLFPPSVSIEITECIPVAYLLYNNSFVTVDINGKILEVSDKKAELPELSGLRLTSANIGEIISLDDNSKLKTVISVLESFRKSGLISGVTVISFEDIDNITFNYENRIDGICGPYVDFSRKLSLFREAITSNKLTENSRGTIDLTKTGKAVYTP